jgi:hypothetical protein
LQANIIQERLKKLLKSGRASLTDPLTASEIQDLLKVSAADAQKISTNPALLRDTTILTEVGNDIASSIARRNQLEGAASISLVEDTIKNIDTDAGIQNRLKVLFGEEGAKELSAGLSKGFEDLRADLFNSVVKNESGLLKIKQGLKALNDYYNSAFYSLLLTVNPRFHGANLQTAAEIVYSTTGKLPNPVDVINGAKLAAESRFNPSGILLQKPTTSAEKVQAVGRQSSNPRFYTNREVYELLQMEGGKSLYTAALPNVNTRRALNLIDNKSNSKFTEALRIAGDTPQVEDMAFRYAVFADAIRSGRTESEAVALARAAMFDAANITDIEKKVQGIFLFYGWARNNLVNLVKNTASSEGRKRIIKALSVGRSAEEVAKELSNISEDEAKFIKGRAPTQIILNKLPREKGSDKDIYNLSTRTPTAEAIKLFGDLVSQPSSVAQGMLTPGLKEVFGVEDTFSKDKRMVSPEHVWLLKEASKNEGADYIEVLNTIVGGEIKPRRARPDEKSVDGYIYPLTTMEQRSRYEAFIKGLTLFGLSRAMSEYYKITSGQGTPARSATGPLGTALYSGAVISPLETVPAWKLELYNKYAKLAAIQGKSGYVAPSGVSALDQEFIKDIIEIDPADAARIKAAEETQKDFLESEKELAQEIEEQTIYDMTVEELVAELSRPNLLKLLRTKFKGDEDALDAYVEEIEARIDKLESESEALKKRK